MTLTCSRPALLLPLALGLLACDEGMVADSEFRSLDDVSSVQTSVELHYELENVLVTSYQLGHSAQDALLEEEMTLLLDGSDGTIEDSRLAFRVDGLAPVAGRAFEDASLVLRRGNEAMETPIAASRFSISIDAGGRAYTAVTLAPDNGVADAADYAVWRDNFGTSAAAAEPVASIEYQLVAVDGSTTTCRAQLAPMEEVSFNYTRVESTSFARMSFGIAANCVAPLQAAAGQKPTDAFYVRCDRSTMTTIVGMHKVSDVTLKRGVINATAEPVVEFVAP